MNLDSKTAVFDLLNDLQAAAPSKNRAEYYKKNYHDVVGAEYDAIDAEIEELEQQIVASVPEELRKARAEAKCGQVRAATVAYNAARDKTLLKKLKAAKNRLKLAKDKATRIFAWEAEWNHKQSHG